MTYATVYEIDWRDVFASLGVVNLNSPGASFTFEGVTWRTPAVADGNAVDQVASVVWQVDAAGLHCESPDNSRMTATTDQAPHVYTTLLQLAANTATPFEADPTRDYIWQCFVSSLTLVQLEDEGAGVSFYKVNQGTAVGNQQMSVCALGHRNGLDGNLAESGVGPTPNGNRRSDIFLNCPTIHSVCSRRQQYYAADFDAGAGAFADLDQLEQIGMSRLGTAVIDNDLCFDPPLWRLACYHNCPTPSPNAYVGVIQRSRLLQQQ